MHTQDPFLAQIQFNNLIKLNKHYFSAIYAIYNNF